MQRITIGAVLPYSLTANDVQDIEVLRAKGHAVNPHHVGQEVPFVVTKIWDAESGSCNGQLLLDGDCTLWRTSLLPCSDGPEGTKPAPGHFWFQRAAALVFGLLIAVLCLAPSVAFAQDAAPTAPEPIGQMLLRMFLQYVLPPLLTAIGTLLVFALTKLVTYLTSKSKESKLAAVALPITGAVKSVVAEVNAGLKQELIEAAADGVITPDEKAKLKAHALDLLKSKLPGELMTALSGVFGGFLDTYLGGLIEREVLDQKATAALASTAARPSSP